ncbi:hypothetical protein PGT21_021402 [Puccinia graminis f. sp. tritici]|uniref:F-box domain-containing protein n=2 Tax=Puccinia graminis f. sp. tritici TaxID=56615 RepID=E3KRA8_PUCGT|nr:uncharacterized protein PGTG_13215 [Puccinia graminis f. sp. tritici CRL 75-36-700-3]EFP86833.2 hypothetical protein PGTG_13215 [Puccinia graminis f. sp. tritici CRL 75-36-700-3]KAA1077831.1 hypothetical protein PGT21_021402 [Puccinia graminis f. sp. tritici]KAA1102600.1 hypothetical protein PGTUg99_022777 [Puccinia graminis f. sp. tritici]
MMASFIKPRTAETGNRTLESLPEDILEQIINHLDLRSISRLSRASHSLLSLTRSDSLWRRIAKALIGPWIHRSLLSTNLNSRSELTHHVQQKHSDWTLDPNCFPLSQFSRSTPSHQSQELLITSWYQFSARFLIPHFHFLGWHVSNIVPHGQLILVTYDTSSGRLLAEEIKCQNLYSTPPDSFFIPPFSLGRSEANSQSSTQHTQAPVWPSWLPLSQIRLDSNRVQYSLAPGIDSPSSRYTFDIFAPAYASSPLFSIFPFEPHYRLACVPSSYQQITIQKPKLIVKPWSTLITKESLTPLCNPAQVIARRSNILSRDILDQEDLTDLLSNPGIGVNEFHSLTLASSPEGPASRVDTPVSEDHARIRYQGGPRQQQVRTSNILLGGRTYTTNGAGLLRPVVHFPIWSIEYYPLNGPTPYPPPPLPPLHRHYQSEKSLEGLWVGCYGSHGTEFGRIIVDSFQISFVKLTGDPNIPAGQVSWKVKYDPLVPLNPIPISEAISIDLGASLADGGWLRGHGQVANTNYEEPGWINTEVQFISNDMSSDSHTLSSDSHQVLLKEEVQQIRVKWIELGRVSTFFKVSFS